MKYWLLALLVALLSACGGGGGGAVSLEPQDDSAALMSQLGEARTEIVASIPADRQEEFERKIAALEQDLNAARASVAELRAQLTAILEEMRNITIPPEIPTAEECHANLQILVDGNCQNCEEDEQFNTANNTCEPLPPTAAECHADLQVLVDDNCESCRANMQFSVDKCIPTAAACHAKSQILVGDNCQNCEAGERFSINECVAIPTAAECHADLQVLVDGNCQSCGANMQFSVDKCIPTAAACYAKSQILVGDNCESCEAGEQFDTATNTCKILSPPTAAECHTEEKVLVGDSCQNCAANMLFRDDQCVAKSTLEAMCNANGMTFRYSSSGNLVCNNSCNYRKPVVVENRCVATVEACNANDHILATLDGRVSPYCNECYSGTQRKGNVCVPTEDTCHSRKQVLVDDNCQSCDVSERYDRDSRECLPVDSDYCHSKRQAFVDGSCQRCAFLSERYDRDSRECRPVDSDYCHDIDSIFVDGSCQRCDNSISEIYDRDSRECRPIIADDCHANLQILVGDVCKVCPENMKFSINQCVELSEFDTAEYLENPMYDAINPLYAYERGYFGQGVTVAVIDIGNALVEHPDLAANYITTTINGISNRRLIKQDGEGFHPTRVAGIIGATRNSIGMHGIAPEVKMIPFIENSIASPKLAAYFRNNHIPIVNNSYGYGLFDELSVVLEGKPLAARAKRFNDYIGDSDSIWVWASGNDGHIFPNLQGFYPLARENLEKNWLVAIAVRPNLTIQDYSNACGPAKDWCVATGVYNVYTTNYDNATNEYEYTRGNFGTSYSAPQVSGALALLYGAIGIQSPQMARAILLTTTTDLGDPGVDEIYGRGLVNISAAIVMIENMKTAGTQALSSVPFANLRGELPSGFSHLHDELAGVKVAVKLTDDLYYNVALSEMLTPGDDSDVPLGDGATDMLADAESDSRRGFFAYGDMDAELGLRYYGGTGGFSYVAEGQHAKTNQRYFSGNFGSLGGVSGKVYSGKVGFVRDMNMAGMQVFGDYERAAVGGDGDEGNLIVGVRDAQAESWMAGMSFGDIWKYGDRIKLSARQEMGLSGGDLIVRYPHAVGDFHETFIGEGTQEIEVREAFLPLKQKALMLYTAGYSQKFTAKSEWATALEYNAGNNAKAFSLIWQGEF